MSRDVSRWADRGRWQSRFTAKGRIVWGLRYVAVRSKGGQCNCDWRARDMILRHHGTMEPRRHEEPRCQPESNRCLARLIHSADLARPLSISFGVSPLDGMSWRRTAISHGSLDRGPHVRRMDMDADTGRCGPLRRNALAVAEV